MKPEFDKVKLFQPKLGILPKIAKILVIEAMCREHITCKYLYRPQHASYEWM